MIQLLTEFHLLYVTSLLNYYSNSNLKSNKQEYKKFIKLVENTYKYSYQVISHTLVNASNELIQNNSFNASLKYIHILGEVYNK